MAINYGQGKRGSEIFYVYSSERTKNVYIRGRERQKLTYIAYLGAINYGQGKRGSEIFYVYSSESAKIFIFAAGSSKNRLISHIGRENFLLIL